MGELYSKTPTGERGGDQISSKASQRERMKGKSAIFEDQGIDFSP